MGASYLRLNGSRLKMAKKVGWQGNEIQKSVFISLRIFPSFNGRLAVTLAPPAPLQFHAPCNSARPPATRPPFLGDGLKPERWRVFCDWLPFRRTAIVKNNFQLERQTGFGSPVSFKQRFASLSPPEARRAKRTL